MSKRCIFQTDQPKINEARCIIPLDLEMGCQRFQRYHTCGSWFCKYRLNEKNCPIVKRMLKEVVT